jgi:hypothetical protein
MGTTRAAFAATAMLLVASVTPAAALPSQRAFSVTSTLDGKRVLPHRIHWSARTSGPASQVAFLVDGTVRWVEHEAPFTFSEDGGYLVTSWLSPGRHRFTVRATSTGGAKATKTVVARVPRAPAPPRKLAGTWRRNVPDAVPPDSAFPGDTVPAGTWTLVVNRRWMENHFPGTFDPATSPQTQAGFVLLSDYTAGAHTFTVYGAVTTGLFDPSVARVGGWWCGPGGPKATYSWSVRGHALTLRAVGGDACSQRGGVMAGTWTHVNQSR